MSVSMNMSCCLTIFLFCFFITFNQVWQQCLSQWQQWWRGWKWRWECEEEEGKESQSGEGEKREKTTQRGERGRKAFKEDWILQDIHSTMNLYNCTQSPADFLPFFNVRRRSRKIPAAPRGQWAPTCCGWTPAVSESSRRTPASPSLRSPRRPERCGDNWAKTRRRWGRRTKTKSDTEN